MNVYYSSGVKATSNWVNEDATVSVTSVINAIEFNSIRVLFELILFFGIVSLLGLMCEREAE